MKGDEYTALTEGQKLAAFQNRFYDFQEWKPREGDYYTSTRSDLQLYRIKSIENGKVYTTFAGLEDVDEWDLKGFTTEGFGPMRMLVPLWVLEKVQ